MSEEVIGTVNSYTVITAQSNKYQCPNCRKQIHCIAGYKNEGDPVEMLKDRCGKDCECKCRHSYLAKNGKLRKYGTVDDTSSIEDMDLTEHKRDANDDFIDQINDDFNSARTDRMVDTKSI